jgi:predicted metal-binding membrane protein
MGVGISAGPSGSVERVRNRTTLIVYAVVIVLTAAAWVHVLTSMPGGDMAGMDMVMAPTLTDALAYVVAWAIMMAAMMLPSALPMIGLYASTQRNARSVAAKAGPVALFVLTYWGLWTLTGVPVYVASLALMAVTAGALAYVVAAVLVIAGLFQLTPLKQVCLRHCRSPIGFLLGHWRAGWTGALAMGWAHALYCLGCCWALMVVLVVAGAMGLPWVLLIACAVAAEKLLPRGAWIARLTGVALVLLGVIVALRPALAAALRSIGPSM